MVWAQARVSTYVRTSVRPSVPRAAARPPPRSELQNMLKRSKPFKINGFGPFWGTHLRSFVYINLKKYARMQCGVRFDTCPFCTGAFYMGSEKRSKQFRINCLGCFWEAFFGGPIWTIEPAKTFPCSVALVFLFRRSAPMQRGAHFAICDVPCGAPCWAQQGRQICYKNNDVLMIPQPLCEVLFIKESCRFSSRSSHSSRSYFLTPRGYSTRFAM